MRTDQDCVFCKIVQGDLPSFKLFESDRVLSFMDINPFHDGHCLVIVKDHAPTLLDVAAADLAEAMQVAQRVATAVNQAGLAPDGFNIVQANGAAAGQTVFHYHMHVFPRRAGDEAKLNWGQTVGDFARVEANQKKILAALAGP